MKTNLLIVQNQPTTYNLQTKINYYENKSNWSYNKKLLFLLVCFKF